MAGSTMAEGGFQVGGPSNEQVDATSGEPPGQSGYCDLQGAVHKLRNRGVSIMITEFHRGPANDYAVA